MAETTVTSYQENLFELNKQLQGMLPTNVLDTFDKEANEMQKTYQSILKVKAGDKAPEFSLPNALNKEVTLNSLLQKGKVVLVFYRGNWCPYCNLQLNLYQKSLDEIEKLGALLVAVSPQTPDNSLNMTEKNELKFEVLSDVGNKVTRQYTKVFRFSDAGFDILKELGYDFNSFYGNDSREIPVPAVFVINQKGIITFAKTEGGDYRNRVEIEEILNALND